MRNWVDKVGLAADPVDRTRHTPLGRDARDGLDALPVLLIGLDEGAELPGVLLGVSNDPALREIERSAVRQ